MVLFSATSAATLLIEEDVAEQVIVDQLLPVGHIRAIGDGRGLDAGV